MDPAVLPLDATRAVLWTQWAYWCSLGLAVLAARYLPPGSVQTAVTLTPLLTAALCMTMTYWLYEDCDEFLRSAVLRCVVRTALVVTAGTVAYFVAELAGAPRIGLLWVNLLGWSVFNLQLVFVLLRSR